MARMLIETSHPVWQTNTIEVHFDGQRRVLLVENDRPLYDYGCVAVMPSTSVRSYRSSSWESDFEE